MQAGPRTLQVVALEAYDELGYLPMNKQNNHNLFQLIHALYEYQSVILTTHKDFTRWGDFFIDENVTVPIADRLIHHAQIFMLGDESYRLRQKMSSHSVGGSIMLAIDRRCAVLGASYFCAVASADACRGLDSINGRDTICHRFRCLTRTRRSALASLPMAGAVCGNSARTDLCGGRQATAVPTATHMPE